ncbi:6-hydroxymethylpterin diphosphokinase MptE-like protein [Clostridium sp. YIM B02555]|uniref:motility associated factor glycosyltransferase family protein n=1 Tax=Clostridium sp. YIM B02555 TaxID=2911968 RepID=UPI001EED51E4|nr:6-hydroxymethylpterin diphosphokinase MptE-like protein [Clostridium sp. YIM B02555]
MSLDIDVSKDGYKILRVKIEDKKVYLGSKYNQRREIHKFLSSLDEPTEKDNYIIFGLSFGEHIEELLKATYESSNILIIEFNEELKEYCKRDLKIKKIFENSRVKLFDKVDDIKEFFGLYINEANVDQLQTLTYANYFKLNKMNFMDTYSIIREELMSVILMRNTGIISGELSFNNFMSNLKYIGKATTVNKLRGKCKNKPAIIVSAGPSLSKNIDNLKGVKNALILSGGRTLRPLMDKKIMPSCVGIVDPGEVSYKVVEEYIDKIKCPLVFNDQVHPKIIERHNENNFITRINAFLDDIWEEPPYILSGGGSIAHSLTALALYMGCNPIVFIGQDLAYTGDRGHDVSAGNKWSELTFDEYKRSDDIYIEDIEGKPVRTSLLLNDYKKSMEEIISKWPEVEFINATEGGANIKGTKIEKLSEVLKGFPKEEITSLNEYLDDEDKTEVLIKKLEMSLKNFEKYIKLCEKAEKLSKDYKQSYYLKNNKKLNEIEKVINKVDNEIRENLSELYILNFALSKVIFEIERNEEFIVKKNDSEAVMFKKSTSRAEAIYSGIKNVVKESCTKVKELTDELKEDLGGK